jgi:hypothetical protein
MPVSEQRGTACGPSDSGNPSSGPSLEDLYAARSFDPAPRLDNLFEMHVPFDTFSRRPSCEQPLGDALRRGDRVALIGVAGAGKTSVTSAVLGPLVEDLAPLPIPVWVERPEVARDPVAFAAHIIRQVASWVGTSMPGRAGAAERIERQSRTPDTGRRQRISIAPSWFIAKVELAYELEQATSVVPPTSRQILDQARQVLDLIESAGMRPVLVLDDTDKWLNTSWQSDAASIRGAFFGRVVRVVAEELAAAAVVAIHPEYLDDPGYRVADGFLDTPITVPPLPNPAAVRAILSRRAAIGLGIDLAGEPTVLDGLIEEAATRRLYDHYRSEGGDIRRHILYVVHTALARGCDDGADLLDARHIEQAIAEVDAARA